MDLFIRVTVEWSQAVSAIELISSKVNRMVVYEHNSGGKNCHIHMYLETCSVSTDTLKNYIRKHVTLDKGNKVWSFKKADDSDCITYMSKGKLDPCYVKGFTQDELIVYKDKWVERTPETSTPKDTVTQYSMAMEVCELVNDKLKKRPDLHTIEIYELCVRYSIETCHKHRKGFCEHSLKKIAQTAYTRVENCKQVFIQKCVDSFFHRI